MIAAVNGAAGAPGTDVTSVAGQIAVSILGTGADDVSLLVFEDAAAGAGVLNLTDATPNNALPKTPTDAFGVGCPTFFVPAEATLGGRSAEVPVGEERVRT